MTKLAKKIEAEEPKVTSNDVLNAALKEHKTEHYNFQERVTWRVSTGSLILDTATGGVCPSLWRLCGNNNSGKTPQMLEIVRNILKDVPNSKALWVLAEGRGLSEENVERCGLKFVYDPADWAIGTVFVLETNVFELFIRIVRDLVRNNEQNIRYAFVVDSIDGLMLRDDVAKDITENNKVAGVPGLSKKMLQSLSLGMFKFGHWMGMISQVTSEIKLDPYAKSTNRGGSFSGGNALLHGSDVILEYHPSYAGDYILDNPSGKLTDGKSKSIGQTVRVTMVKSSLEATKKRPFEYPIKFGRKPSGIWVEREIADMLLWGLVTKGGSWLTLTEPLRKELKENGIDSPEKVQGLDNLYDWLENNPEATAYLKNKFTRMHGKEINE